MEATSFVELPELEEPVLEEVTEFAYGHRNVWYSYRILVVQEVDDLFAMIPHEAVEDAVVLVLIHHSCALPSSSTEDV